MDAEHDEIAKSKQEGEALTWEDVTRMKLSRAPEDIEVDGYVIPKGWQAFWSPCVTHMDPAKFLPSRFDAQAASAAPPPPLP
uniref:Uncharacterized protein n=1 Tax=Oryza nivara TaxID=4536 RepID=A0A0E0I1H4_ORYNI